MRSRSNTLAAVAAGCSVLGVGGWVFYVVAFHGLHGEDWMVFYTAARSVLGNNLAVLYDGDRLTAALNARFAGVLAHKLPLHPFLYPPHYLLVITPFGFLPPATACILFLGVSGAALLAALSHHCRTREEFLFVTGALLLCPAAAITVCLGQNSFLTCALLVGGFALSRERPVLGGILLGILSYKPQLALMVPFALIASRQWKTLAAAFLSASILCLASVALFGLEPWRAWFDLMLAPSPLFERWNTIARLNGQSIHAYAVYLGASSITAHFLQLLSTALAATLVYWCNRRPMQAGPQIAILLLATMFSAPHLLDYDAMLLEIAAALFLLQTLRDGPTALESCVAVLIWLSPLVNPPTAFPIGALTPFVTLLLLALTVRRGLAGLPVSGKAHAHSVLAYEPAYESEL